MSYNRGKRRPQYDNYQQYVPKDQQQDYNDSQQSNREHNQYKPKYNKQDDYNYNNNRNGYYRKDDQEEYKDDQKQQKSGYYRKDGYGSENRQQYRDDRGGYKNKRGGPKRYNNNTRNNNEDQILDAQKLDLTQQQSSNTSQNSNPSNHRIYLEIDPQKLTLNTITSMLITKFIQKQVECIICSQKIFDKAAIWNFTYEWDCPTCKHQYNEKLPDYYCFCGKIRNPYYEKYNLPHSCGDQCQKSRGINCIHHCDLLCHPGTCPPCSKEGPLITCYCFKNKMKIKCSDNFEFFKCGQVCDKKLNCDIHNCQELCHDKGCKPCQVEVDAKCFCNKLTKKVLCGQDKFKCQSQCGKMLDCGNHFCEQICHEGPCQKCQLKPELVKKCPCGQYDLLFISTQERQTCLDPIPCCGMPCRKPLTCDEHYCKRSCHRGDCDNCQIDVMVNCRCESTRVKIQCWTLYEEDQQPPICEKICKKKLRCKVHTCGEQCCQKTRGEHLCLKVCGKPLSCAKHSCADFCHIGSCETCRVLSTQPISCECGNTSIKPPVKCGTKPPECTLTCSRQRECGHPCDLQCHTDSCPPCLYPVAKLCRCQQNTIPYVPCHQEALCLTKCQKVMTCDHQCNEVCHTGSCPKESPEGCGKRCGKNKKGCQHLCTSICHPGKECPLNECQVEVKVKCSCGNREAYVECGSTENELERYLPCNNVCANYKRFGQFYNQKKQTYFPANLLRFAKNNYQYLQKLEQNVENMIKQNKDSIEMPFIQDQKKKLAIQVLLERHYNMETQYYVNFKNPFFVIRITDNMIVPKPLLSEYYKKVEKGQIKPDILPFQVTIRFSNFGRGENSQMLESILREFKGQYYLEKDDKSLLLHFWEQDYANLAVLKLKKSQSTFNQFLVEENARLQKEESKEDYANEEVVRTLVLKKKIASQNEAKQTDLWTDEILNEQVDTYFQQNEQICEKAQCLQMCPEQEVQERSKNMNISIWEQDPRTPQMKAFSKWMVKSFLRIDSNMQDKPEMIRSLDTLQNTLNYLINQVLTADTMVNTYFKLPQDKHNKTRNHTFMDIYTFVYDRFKAIRQDLTVISDYSASQYAFILQRMIRFYIIAQVESIPSVNMDLNTKEMQCCLSMLMKCERIDESFSEFYAYLIFYSLSNEMELQKILQQLDQNLLNSDYVNGALQVVSYIKQNEYLKFFKFIKNSDVLTISCLVQYVDKMRYYATQNLIKSQYQVTLNEYIQDLLFDIDQDALDYLKGFGINTDNLLEPIEPELELDDESIKEKLEQLNKKHNSENQEEEQKEEEIKEQEEKIVIQKVFIDWSAANKSSQTENSKIDDIILEKMQRKTYPDLQINNDIFINGSIIPRSYFINGDLIKITSN